MYCLINRSNTHPDEIDIILSISLMSQLQLRGVQCVALGTKVVTGKEVLQPP